jgi:AbrB family looped-hinge helix DNA binding protein
MKDIQRGGAGEDFHVKLGAAGRMVMPAPIRARFHMVPGDTLVLRSRPDGAVEMRTRDQVIQGALAQLSALSPERVLSEELIEERRRDAEAE